MLRFARPEFRGPGAVESATESPGAGAVLTKRRVAARLSPLTSLLRELARGLGFASRREVPLPRAAGGPFLARAGMDFFGNPEDGPPAAESVLVGKIALSSFPTSTYNMGFCDQPTSSSRLFLSVTNCSPRVPGVILQGPSSLGPAQGVVALVVAPFFECHEPFPPRFPG